MLTANAAGMKHKVHSLLSIITSLKIGMFTLQETHFQKKGKIKIQGWQTFESIRKSKGGGTMIGAHESLNPILIAEYSELFELIVIEITVCKKDIRVVSGYGPQECWKPKDKMPFYLALEEEISKAEIAGKTIIMGFDANSKLGPEWITKDPHRQYPNGLILAGILERHAMIVANGDKDKCQGTVTRKRTTVDTTEISAIDFIIMSHDIEDQFLSLKIDEEQHFPLSSIIKTKKGTVIKNSDHNTLICNFQFKFNPHMKKDKTKIFNFKDPKGLKKFQSLTTGNKKLSNILNSKTDLDQATKKFIKAINGLCHQSFKKIQIRDIQNKDILQLFNKRRILRNKEDAQSKKELAEVNDQLAEKCA